MALIHWAVVDMNGDLIGQHSQLFVSSNLKKYNDFVVPIGYKKVLLSNREFMSLSDSFNRERKIYEKHINPATSKAKKLPESKKVINEAKAKPKWFRIYAGEYIETKDQNGKIISTVLTPAF